MSVSRLASRAPTMAGCRFPLKRFPSTLALTSSFLPAPASTASNASPIPSTHPIRSPRIRIPRWLSRAAPSAQPRRAEYATGGSRESQANEGAAQRARRIGFERGWLPIQQIQLLGLREVLAQAVVILRRERAVRVVLAAPPEELLLGEAAAAEV